MSVQYKNFGIYNVDVDYLKYLHDNIDSEVYYTVNKSYETKPFIGIIVGIGQYSYFIPFTSAKQKHIKMKNVALDYYLIYEIVNKKFLADSAIFKPYKDNYVLHILAMLEIKKMIPVSDGLFTQVDFGKVSDTAYLRLLQKEYRFCQSVQNDILKKAEKIYSNQKESGIVRRFYCNFIELEKGCDDYKSESK